MLPPVPACENRAVDQYSIIFEDADLIVADKLGPLPVQAEKSGDPSLQDLLSARIEAAEGATPAFLEAVHRIDRRSSGAIVFARSKKAAAALSEALRQGKIAKTYLAVVDRPPEPQVGSLVNWLRWDPRKDKAFVVAEGSPDAKKAILSYRVRTRSERYTCLEISLETGRPHQIRAQLAAIGLPVRGDLKYGARRSTPNGLIMLHAFRLRFSHPSTGQSLELEAPLPPGDPLWEAFGR